MSTCIALAIGGILGVFARYGMTRFINAAIGSDFPFATLTINVLGCFIMAFLFVATLERFTVSPALRAGIFTGGLGAFTTFSTFIMEAVLLIEGGETGKAVLYLALSITLGLIAAFGAVYIAHSL